MCSLTRIGLLLPLLVVLLGFFWQLLDKKGAFEDVIALNDDKCIQSSDESIGNEDMVVMKNGIVVISSDERGWVHKGLFIHRDVSQSKLIEDYPLQGAIYFFDPNGPEKKTVKANLKEFNHPDFHPHGLGILNFPEETGRKPFLFVVNHVREGDAVDVFEIDYENLSLHFKYRVLEKEMKFNDVEPFNEDSFFVSRMTYYGQEDFPFFFESIFNPEWSSVMFCEKFPNETHSCQTAIGNQIGANGVSISKDRQKLFIAHMFARKVDVYSITARHPDEKQKTKLSVSFLYDIPVNMLVDNLFVDEVDSDGKESIFATGHINGLQIAYHLIEKSYRSSGKVLKITGSFSDKSSIHTSDIMITHGNNYSGVSVSVRVGTSLIVGSIFEKGFLICSLK